MLTSISPVGEHGRGQRWWLTAASYVVGSAVGGAVVGTAAGAMGRLAFGPDTGAAWRPAALAGALVAGLVLERAGRLPMLRRQVNERWLDTYRGWVYGGGFGLQLGAGVLTRVTTSLVYAVIVAAALTGSVAAGALVVGAFGLVRALPLLVLGGVDDPAELRDVHRRVAARAGMARTGTRVLQAATAALLLALVVA